MPKKEVEEAVVEEVAAEVVVDNTAEIEAAMAYYTYDGAVDPSTLDVTDNNYAQVGTAQYAKWEKAKK